MKARVSCSENWAKESAVMYVRVKLAILHSDPTYLNRLSSALEAKYRNRLLLHSFTSLEKALEALGPEKIDVFLADDVFEIDTEALPEKCGFAYLVDSPELDTLRGRPAVCQFQRTELLYKNVLNIFSEALGDASVRNLYSDRGKVIIFSSPCGGSGTSTLAAACTAYFALTGKQSLYLNLEDFGSADTYFSGEGVADMSDVVYAVKRRRGSLPIKLESYARRDSSNACYFSTAKMALDMLELNAADRQELVSVLVESGGYDYVIVDMPFDLHKESRELFQKAHALVWVSDGTAVANQKTARAYEALRVLEQGGAAPLADRVCLLLNKIPTGMESELPALGMPVVGAVAKIRHQMNESITSLLADSPAASVFDAILGT